MNKTLLMAFFSMTLILSGFADSSCQNCSRGRQGGYFSGKREMREDPMCRECEMPEPKCCEKQDPCNGPKDAQSCVRPKEKKKPEVRSRKYDRSY